MNPTQAPAQPLSQRMRALERANQVRLARAALKRRIKRGEITAGEVIRDCPAEAQSMALAELLLSQRMLGPGSVRRMLLRIPIAESRSVGSLTERQRGLLCAALSHSPDRSGMGR